LAALYTKEKKLNDCLVLNSNGNIADSTIANVFIIKDGVVFTPSLSEGCISGVMRRFLIEKLRSTDFELREEALAIKNLEEADEVFLTNAIKGIRWVKQFRYKIYPNINTMKIYEQIIKKNFC
jgi:branched-chain amino acid aminotransferase